MAMATIYTGEVYRTPLGKWNWRLLIYGVRVADGSGYELVEDAQADMEEELRSMRTAWE